MVRSFTLVLIAALTLLSAPEVHAGRRHDGRRCRKDSQCLSGTCCSGRCSPQSASCNELPGVAAAAPDATGQGKPPPSEKCRNGFWCGTCGVCRKGRCTGGETGRCWSCQICSEDGSACIAVPDGPAPRHGPDGYYSCGPDAHGALQCCSGNCVDTHGDIENCGACGNACTDGKSCNAISTGGWECKCRYYETECNGRCADLQNDPNNCGQCGHVCGPGSGGCSHGQCDCVTHCDGSGNCTGGDAACGPCESCNNGSCDPTCNGGQTCCAGAGCVDTETDPDNCGTCGNVCQSGSCTSGACTCPAGQTDCDGACKDLQGDRNNCGTCGNACPAELECIFGSCQNLCPPCEVFQDGACMPKDCGQCATCNATTGQCESTCGGGQICCNDTCVNGDGLCCEWQGSYHSCPAASHCAGPSCCDAGDIPCVGDVGIACCVIGSGAVCQNGRCCLPDGVSSCPCPPWEICTGCCSYGQ